MDKLTKALGTIVVFLVALVCIAVIRGLALSLLWGWFIAPLGVTDIGIPEAIGVSMVVGLLTTQEEPPKEQDLGFMGLLAVALFKTTFLAAFVLVIGFVVHQFAW